MCAVALADAHPAELGDDPEEAVVGVRDSHRARALGDDIKTDLEHAYDGYTPEDGEAEADTGVEPPRPTEKTAVTTDAAAPEPPEKEPEK